MTTAQLEAVESAVPDIGDLPLDVEADIDDVRYRLMRRISGEDGVCDTPVSAFNSSI